MYLMRRVLLEWPGVVTQIAQILNFLLPSRAHPSLDNEYTVFGKVTAGMEYIDALQRGEPPSPLQTQLFRWISLSLINLVP